MCDQDCPLAACEQYPGLAIGIVTPRRFKPAVQFGWIHAMARPSQNTLYVGELLNWRVQKLLLKP